MTGGKKTLGQVIDESLADLEKRLHSIVEEHLSPRPTTPTSPPPKVGPQPVELVWTKMETSSEGWKAEHPFGVYCIVGARTVWQTNIDGRYDDFFVLEEAKRSCQRDFEEKVRRCLTTAATP